MSPALTPSTTMAPQQASGQPARARANKRLRARWRMALRMVAFRKSTDKPTQEPSQEPSQQLRHVDSGITARLERIEKLHQLLETSDRCGWLSAGNLVRLRLRQAYAVLIKQAETTIDSINGSLKSDPVVGRLPSHGFQSEREIFADLMALDDEFPEVEIDRKLKSISVVTDAIELEGVFLGPFEICLWCDHWPFYYDIIARDPHPASRSDSYTHPHVYDGNLCEGEGVAAIRQSLQNGRLMDFFTIVRQILETYNSDGAYVSLPDWDGSECRECGDSISGGEVFACDTCHCELCENCQYSCRRCGDCVCSECKRTCSGCDEVFCAHCLELCQEACQGCGESFCDDCLNQTPNEEYFCDDCFEKHQESLDENVADPEPQPSDASEATV